MKCKYTAAPKVHVIIIRANSWKCNYNHLSCSHSAMWTWWVQLRFQIDYIGTIRYLHGLYVKCDLISFWCREYFNRPSLSCFFNKAPQTFLLLCGQDLNFRKKIAAQVLTATPPRPTPSICARARSCHSCGLRLAKRPVRCCSYSGQGGLWLNGVQWLASCIHEHGGWRCNNVNVKSLMFCLTPEQIYHENWVTI